MPGAGRSFSEAKLKTPCPVISSMATAAITKFTLLEFVSSLTRSSSPEGVSFMNFHSIGLV